MENIFGVIGTGLIYLLVAGLGLCIVLSLYKIFHGIASIFVRIHTRRIVRTGKPAVAKLVASKTWWLNSGRDIKTLQLKLQLQMPDDTVQCRTFLKDFDVANMPRVGESFKVYINPAKPSDWVFPSKRDLMKAGVPVAPNF